MVARRQFGESCRMANRLREFRKARKLTLEALAERAGTSAAQISRLEKDQRGFAKAWAERLAPHLGTTWWELLGAPSSGLAESGAPLAPPEPPDSDARRDEEFAEITEALHAMLTEHRMPADPRTLARLARQVERDMAVYAALPFEDRLGLVLSETLSRLQRKWAEALSHR